MSLFPPVKLPSANNQLTVSARRINSCTVRNKSSEKHYQNLAQGRGHGWGLLKQRMSTMLSRKPDPTNPSADLVHTILKAIHTGVSWV